MAPVGDIAALTNSLHAVATDARLRRDLVTASRRIAARFSWDACADEHRILYADMLRATETA
jgi:glycosyltransferase involved in cell wall biosynthesis